MKATHGNYPAPLQILDVFRAGLTHGFQVGLVGFWFGLGLGLPPPPPLFFLVSAAAPFFFFHLVFFLRGSRPRVLRPRSRPSPSWA